MMDNEELMKDLKDQTFDLEYSSSLYNRRRELLKRFPELTEPVVEIFEPLYKQLKIRDLRKESILLSLGIRKSITELNVDEKLSLYKNMINGILIEAHKRKTKRIEIYRGYRLEDSLGDTLATIRVIFK